MDIRLTLYNLSNNFDVIESMRIYIDGAFLILLDGLSTGYCSTITTEFISKQCFEFLFNQIKSILSIQQLPKLYDLLRFSFPENFQFSTEDICLPRISKNGGLEVCIHNDDINSKKLSGISPYFIENGSYPSKVPLYSFEAPTISRNLYKLLRAMQLSKSILLESSPGAGKTSLITALGAFSGHRIVRINLSEQTDMMDLLGSDLPVSQNSCNENELGSNSDKIGIFA